MEKHELRAVAGFDDLSQFLGGIALFRKALEAHLGEETCRSQISESDDRIVLLLESLDEVST